MNLFSNQRAKRNTAFVVLPVWLLALAMGFANACLLEVPETHSHVATVGTSETAHAHAVSDHHAGAGHGDDADTFKAPCLKVCDDGSHSLPTQRSDVDHADHGMAAVIAVLWAVPVPIVAMSYRVGDRQFHVPGPPLRVRYSRLTI